MSAWPRRMTFALLGASATGVVVAMAEGADALRAAGGASGPSFLAVSLADLGLLAPFLVALAFMVGGVMLVLEPDRARPPREYLARLREEPILSRSRTAALLPLAVVAAFVWCLATAHLARAALAEGDPWPAGIDLASSSMALLLGLAVVVLSVLPTARRLLARGAATSPRWVDPVTTGGFALAFSLALLVYGIWAGDTGGGGGTLEIFGVLKRSELDLRPVIDVVAIAMGAYLFPIALAARGRGGLAVVAAFVALIPLVVTVREAKAMNRDATLARAIDRGAPLGRVALQALRRATDRDKDGASPYFGGGDCDDHDPRRSPFAVDIPGNGIDEDCSGEDLPLPSTAPKVVRPAAPAALKVDPEMNLLLITVDTLRIDVGFMGYDKPVTPNLDALAAKGTVFDRAYSMASYTGKSVGPILIGKYPSETQRDGGHFNSYRGNNTLVTKRFKEAQIHTMGAASHWYFVPWSGLTQAMDVWDTSAMPASGQGDNDTSITSSELSDAAIRLLSKHENTDARFFMWLHYFDPHEQYMPHDGIPEAISEGATGPLARTKAAYDGEVWFTDKHIGRVLAYIESQPWGARTAVVLTSDHGEAFEDHGMNWHGGEIWESLVRVPLLVYVPGMKPHHVPVKRSQIDLVPTLLDIMSVPQPEEGELSGKSMMADLSPLPSYEERDVYVDMPIGPYTGMRHALIAGTTPGMKLYHFGGDQFALFDLANDPGEKDDLVRDQPEKFKEMLGLFLQKRAHLKEIEVAPQVTK